MQRIFWLGNPFFQSKLQDLGRFHCGYSNFNEMRLFGWDDIVQTAGFTPDILVVADKSLPPFVLGMEKFPCFTVLYCVDSHIHSWQPIYAQGYDACLVSLRDHASNFASPLLPDWRVWWSPPYACDTDRPSPDTSQPRQWDCLFVGHITENTPKRRVFMEKIRERFGGLHTTTGQYQKLYPKGEIILNYCEHGDLNFRVFEAMGCGSCLLTPRIGHGLTELFADGQCLQTYTPDDVDDVLDKMHSLLRDNKRREQMRKLATACIDAGHRASHRARALADKLDAIANKQEIISERLKKADFICDSVLKFCYLQWANSLSDENLKRGYLAAANGNFHSWNP